jgi:pantoate--beta-alanine ligase
MSSRNMRLSENRKTKCRCHLQVVIISNREHLRKGDTTRYKMEAANMITAAGFEKIDYVEIADAVTLETVDHRGTAGAGCCWAGGCFYGRA